MLEGDRVKEEALERCGFRKKQVKADPMKNSEHNCTVGVSLPRGKRAELFLLTSTGYWP